MKAIIINEYGTADKLLESDLDIPTLEDNQVLVELHATSINPIDWKIRAGDLEGDIPFEFPIILGWDAAGIVKKIGNKVTNHTIGDRVFASPVTTANGTYAEYVTVEEDLLAKIPENITFDEAAATPLACLTAWQCLVNFSEVNRGDKVLIHAGSGGVGSFAIQIAKHFGAYVASTASDKNESLLEELGVDEYINYKTEDFSDKLSDYDIVVDTIGGEIQEKSFKVLKKGGKLVSIVEAPNKEIAAKKNIKADFLWLKENGKQLAEIATLMKIGKIKPIIGNTFPLSRDGVKKAHELSESHHTKGKIIIKVK